MRDLARFQRDFGRALLGDENLPGLEIALTVHRNTSIKGWVDALAANYPTVVQLVGEEWFKACAIEYVRAHPARTPVLAEYGETFPAFLAEFPPAAQLPYLAEVARIDRLWVEAHTARDAPVLTPADLASLSQSELGTPSLSPHPAARTAWVRHSAATIWIHHRSSDPGAALEVDDCEEGILLTRPAGRVEYQLLNRAAFELLAGLLAKTIVAGAFQRPAETLS